MPARSEPDLAAALRAATSLRTTIPTPREGEPMSHHVARAAVARVQALCAAELERLDVLEARTGWRHPRPTVALADVQAAVGGAR